MSDILKANEKQYLVSLYEHMFTSREIDRIEESYTQRGEAFFHVSGGGHEAGAALARHLNPEDWLHCHYRDKALMLARGMEPIMFFHSLFNKDASHSRGRQMNAHMSDPSLRILSLVGPVGNSGLQAVGVAQAVRDEPSRPLVLCALGDGMSQQGEILEAVAHAVRGSLPVLFLIEDNGLAISTRTGGKTFYQLPDGPADSFYGIPIHRVDGRDPAACDAAFSSITAEIRETRNPALVVMSVERLSNHTNADDQRVYRSEDEITNARATGDPVLVLRQQLIAAGADEEKLGEFEERRRGELEGAARESQLSAEPVAVHDAVKPYGPALLKAGDTDSVAESGEAVTMIEALRTVLDARMAADERVVLFGEDIEDPKGDVFGVTRGLTGKYPGRVRNAPLAEASIIGISGGEALAGKRPVAFLQFADFLPIAYNQIISELGSMYWRTDGGWESPVIVMISCGGYKPGLGPFHAQSMDGTAAHTPGVDVFMPSRAEDAAGLLNAAFLSERPTLFFYPKNLLNSRDFASKRDPRKLLVKPGRLRRLTEGTDITLVGWGNATMHCLKAAEALKAAGASAEVIDLRTLRPWDVEGVVASAEKTGRLIVVHEDNHTAGMGGEILGSVAERAKIPVRMRRVTRGDTFVPCNFGNQLEVLPSFKAVLEAAVALLDGKLSWQADEVAGGELYRLEAVGSSPSDEVVTVIEWLVAEGEVISEGQEVAELEADKAMVTLSSPVAGTLVSLDTAVGATAKVGEAIASIRLASGEVRIKPITREEPGTPVIRELKTGASPSASAGNSGPVAALAGVAGVMGSRTVSNREISLMCPTWSEEDIVKRTGIRERHWVGEGENALTLAVAAAEELFATHKVGINDIDMLICSTETPIFHTPSMATLIQHSLNERAGAEADCPAYDINAACSGYVYGLQIAHDYLAQKPDHRILLITTDVLSDRIDTADPSTAPVFADGATASLLVGAARMADGALEIRRPVLSAHGEDGSLLRIPGDPAEPVFMEGPEVFRKAVSAMAEILKDACREAGVEPESLDLVVPHQANQRIIDAVRQKMKTDKKKVYSMIAEMGNTSSSTIPFCLQRILNNGSNPELIGLTAFGGGFTFAGGVLKRLA